MKRSDRLKANVAESLGDPLTPALSAAPARLRDAALHVWRGLAADVREVLVRRWRERRPIVYAVDAIDPYGRAVVAKYLRECEALIFTPAAVDLLSDDGLRALFAHELAHAHQAATGRPGDEREAVATAASWRFTFYADYEAALWGRAPGFEGWAPIDPAHGSPTGGE